MVEFLARKLVYDAMFLYDSSIISRDGWTEIELQKICLAVVPGKTSLRLTGGLLVSTVILYLAFLTAEEG